MGVLSVLIVVAVWWLATHGKGSVSARLGAWLALIIVVWVLLAVKDPAAADGMPGAFASGIGQAVSALGRFLGMFSR